MESNMSHLILSLLPNPRRPVVKVLLDVSIKRCTENLLGHDIGALVVTDMDDNILGILSERDLVRKCLSQNLDVHTTTAGEICNSNISILSIDDTIEKAMETITRTKRRHILIKERDELVAMVSIGDILFYMLDDNKHIIEQLENYIHTY